MNISIIIPIKNSAKTLPRCIDSILKSKQNAKIKDLEILLIDNGSTDDSIQIEQDYQKIYSFIKILNCQTPGAAAAKNYGAKNAKSDYLWFIDADDYIAESALTLIFKKLNQTHPDLLMFSADQLDQNAKITRHLSAVDHTDPNYKSRFIRYGMGPWQVVIKTKWWQNHHFKFQEGYIHEDMGLMSALILHTDRYQSIDDALYFYCETQNSVLHSKKWDQKYFDIFPALKHLYELFKKANAEKTYASELEWFFVWNLLIDSAADFKKWPEGRPGLKKSREMLKTYFPHWRQNPFLKQKPWKLKLLVRMNYYGINKP